MIGKDELKKLMENHKIAEIAQLNGVCPRTIANWIAKYDLSYETIRLEKYPSELTKLQKEFIVGSLLGDGCIRRDGSYKFDQTARNKPYVDYVYRTMQPFSKYYREAWWKNPISKNGKITGRSSTKSKGYEISTIIHPIFKKLRCKWYTDHKIVPADLKLNPYILAIWHVDDGSNRSKNIRLNTQSFAVEDVEKLISCLRRDLAINASLKFDKNEQPYIWVGAGSYFAFIEMVTKHVHTFGCFKHKVDMSNAPPDRKIISDKIKEEICHLYGELTQVELAKRHNISQGSVSRIVGASCQSSVIGC
jgi:hypothetical protein